MLTRPVVLLLLLAENALLGAAAAAAVLSAALELCAAWLLPPGTVAVGMAAVLMPVEAAEIVMADDSRAMTDEGAT